MRIGVIGVNRKQADLKSRETVARALERRFESFHCYDCNSAFVLLSTCNRTEIYFSSEDLPTTHSYLLNLFLRDLPSGFDQKLYSFFEGDCFKHLARVATGLDSAILLETEIQGQVKLAYEKALRIKHLPKEMHFLFQKCLKIGKQVRSTLSFSRAMPEVDSGVFQAVQTHLQDLSKSRVLFVGASEINLKVLRFFKQQNFASLTLCNRSLARAKEIASNEGVELIAWEELSNWHDFDVVIVATKHPDYLLTHQTTSQKPRVLIDLAVPRNIDPALADSGAALYNIDQLDKMIAKGRRLTAAVLDEAETMVKGEVLRQLGIFSRRLAFQQALSLCRQEQLSV